MRTTYGKKGPSLRDALHQIDLIRKSNGWTEHRENQEWIGPPLHHIEDAIKNELKRQERDLQDNVRTEVAHLIP